MMRVCRQRLDMAATPSPQARFLGLRADARLHCQCTYTITAQTTRRGRHMHPSLTGVTPTCDPVLSPYHIQGILITSPSASSSSCSPSSFLASSSLTATPTPTPTPTL